MSKSETIAQINKWLVNPDYETGLSILASIKPSKASRYAGSKSRYHRKVIIALCSFAGVDYTKLEQKEQTRPEIQQKEATTPGPGIPVQGSKPSTEQKKTLTITGEKPQAPAIDETSAPGQQQQSSTDFDPDEDLPFVIKKITREHAHMVAVRSKIAQQRAEIPENNEPDNVASRKTLSQSIEQISDRIEILFSARKEYLQNKTMPDMAALFPGDKLVSINDIHQLRKHKTNLLKSNSKDKNLLTFQSPTKLKKPNPLPHGPDRDKIQQRLKAREEEIQYIDYLISKIN